MLLFQSGLGSGTSLSAEQRSRREGRYPKSPRYVSQVEERLKQMRRRLHTTLLTPVRSLMEANRSPSMRALDLTGSSDLLCVNMVCEKVGEPCVCRLSRVLERNGRELRSLVLAGNKLTQLPASVFELQHLQVLDLSENELTEIPADVVKLESLKILDVRNNPISGIPKDVAKRFYGLVEIRWDGSHT